MNTLHLGRLTRTPLSVFGLSAGVAFALGFASTVISGSDAPHFFVFLPLAVVVIALAVIATFVVIRVIPREDLDIEVVLYLLPSALIGAVVFFPMLALFVIGVYLPFGLGLVEWNDDDGEMNWLGFVIIFLIGAALLAVIVGGPVGVVAWASRLVGHGQR